MSFCSSNHERRTARKKRGGEISVREAGFSAAQLFSFSNGNDRGFLRQSLCYSEKGISDRLRSGAVYARFWHENAR